jgi:hypothetical protein
MEEELVAVIKALHAVRDGPECVETIEAARLSHCADKMLMRWTWWKHAGHQLESGHDLAVVLNRFPDHARPKLKSDLETPVQLQFDIELLIETCNRFLEQNA